MFEIVLLFALCTLHSAQFLMILVVGNINYDILFPLGKLPGPHEKLECGEGAAGFGGSAANTAWWLAGMGLPVTLAGAVGSDPFGEAHLAKLMEAGVRTAGVDRVSGVSGLAVVLSLGREKRMIRAPGANLLGKVHPELLNGCRLLYLSGSDRSAMAGYAEEASSRGIPVVCGRQAAEDERTARAANGFILNADEAAGLTGITEPKESIRVLDSPFAAITLPHGGCVVSQGIEVHEVPAPELEPVDRTGGGDAFSAAFLAGFYLGKEITECGRMGNRLAAAVIMEKGARPGISIWNLGLGIGDAGGQGKNGV
jgi:sugar/nucleoside kinase (ribokinase family)